MKFPNLYKIVSKNDVLKPYTNYAIVETGKIVAIKDGALFVYHDLEQFADNPEKAENKVFTRDLLKWMADKKWSRIVFLDDWIKAYSKNDIEMKPYSGYINFSDNKKYGYRSIIIISGTNEEEKGIFPDWKVIIPQDHIYKECKGFKAIGLNPNLLSLLKECFYIEEGGLKFEFGEENKQIRITPINQSENYKQQAIILPYRL